jgi:dimeric dUTPase (all-alpha-NTP-PPase superfamily)
MNIKDFPDIVLPDGDLLELIFKKQKQLEDLYHDIESKNLGIELPRSNELDINSHRGQYFLKDLAWRVTEELGEAMNCLKLKPWKSTAQLTDIDHYLEEIVDALHFFIMLMQFSGFDHESAAKYYLMKNEVNKFRQRSNY